MKTIDTCYVVNKNDFTGSFSTVCVFADLADARKFVCNEMDVIANALSVCGHDPVLDELKSGIFTVYVQDSDIYYEFEIVAVSISSKHTDMNENAKLAHDIIRNLKEAVRVLEAICDSRI